MPLKTEYTKVQAGKMRYVEVLPGVVMDTKTDKPLGLGLMVRGDGGEDHLVCPLKTPEDVAEFLISVTIAAGIAFSAEAVDAAINKVTEAKAADDASAKDLPN